MWGDCWLITKIKPASKDKDSFRTELLKYKPCTKKDKVVGDLNKDLDNFDPKTKWGSVKIHVDDNDEVTGYSYETS